MSEQHIHARYEAYLRQIGDYESELEKRLVALKECRVSWADQQKLIQNIRERVVQLEASIKEWENMCCDECDSEAEKETILAMVRRHSQVAHHYHIDMRKAIVYCKREWEHRHDKERQELLHSRKWPESSFEDHLITDTPSKDLKEALTRTTDLMANEVEKSQQILRTLAESSHTIVSSRSEYRGFSGILKETQWMVRHLWQRDITDRYLILFALCVYALVVIYIIKRRILPEAPTDTRVRSDMAAL
jgi:protein transport protein SEC20